MSNVSLPGGARLAITVQFLTELWATSGNLPDSVYPNRCLGATRDYGVKEGAPRILGILKKHNVKSTAMFSGLVCERFPELVRTIADDGHEIAGHGWDQSKYTYKNTREEEHEIIKKCTHLLESASGRKPLGWGSPGRSLTDNTLDLLAEEGYVWNGDLNDTELPYPVKAGGKTIMMVPQGSVTMDLEEFVLFDREGHRQTLRGAREALDFMMGQFEACYSQATPKAPLRMTIGCHAFVAGHPDYTWALDKFITHAKGFKDVVFLTNLETAQWWLKNCL